MAKGSKTSPEVVEKIKLCRATGMSYAETARFCGVGDNTVFMIMKRITGDPKQNKEFEELCVQKKRELSENASKEFDESIKASLEKLFKKSVKVIDKAIDENKLSPRDAVSVMGTTFDKRQILTGGKTANVGVTFDEILDKINNGDEY